MREIYLQSQEARITSAQYDRVVELLLKTNANLKMKTDKRDRRRYIYH